jgi:type IV pilus assembly protein PilQ
MRLRRLVMSTLAAVALAAPSQATDGLPASGDSAQLLTIETSDKALDTVLQWISRRAGVNVVCNEQDQPRITLRLSNVTWQEAVSQIATKYDLVVEKPSDRIWVLTRPPKVRMEFQDARLGVVLEALARQAGVNIVFSDIDAEKKITMTLNGVPWKEALDVIVRDAGFAWIQREYNIIQVVSPDKLQKDLTTRIFEINYKQAADLKDTVASVVGKEATVEVPKGSNYLMVTATVPALESAAKVIERLDTRTRQVKIEMQFVEFNDSDVQRAGFDPINLGLGVENFGTIRGAFSPFNASPTASVSTTRELSNIPTTTGNITGALTFEAIASLSTTEVLQKPTVLTTDNQEAMITIGREIHFAEETIAQQDNSAPVRSLKEASTSPVNDGITIKVTPHITGDGFVSITLDASNTDVTLDTYTNKKNDEDPNASTIKLPIKSTQLLKTTIMIQDGKVGIIGGLLRDRTVEKEAHIPLLGDIPILGNLFKKREDTKEKRNLTIFITPRIIHTDSKSEFEKQREALKSRLSGIKPKVVEAPSKPE